MNINLINVPIKYGSGKDGTDLAYGKFVKLGLYKLFENSKHHLSEKISINVNKLCEQEQYKDHPKLKYLSVITEVNDNLAVAVYESLLDEKFPLIVGGDHSLAAGSISGASLAYNHFGVVYIDAHGDFNTTTTSLSHNMHGMPLAGVMDFEDAPLTEIFYVGQKLKPENLFHIGGRDFDEGEEKIINSQQLNIYTMNTIRDLGLEISLNKIITAIQAKSFDGVHLSFDIDVLDPSVMPGTGSLSNNGFCLSEAKLILSKLLKTGLITSIDFVEYNPLLDDFNETTLKNCLDLIKHILDSL